MVCSVWRMGFWVKPSPTQLRPTSLGSPGSLLAGCVVAFNIRLAMWGPWPILYKWSRMTRICNFVKFHYFFQQVVVLLVRKQYLRVQKQQESNCQGFSGVLRFLLLYIQVAMVNSQQLFILNKSTQCFFSPSPFFPCDSND